MRARQKNFVEKCVYDILPLVIVSHKVLAECGVMVCDIMDFVRLRKFKVDAFAVLYIIPFFHENQRNTRC